jgi:hypothetical protein
MGIYIEKYRGVPAAVENTEGISVMIVFAVASASRRSENL